MKPSGGVIVRGQARNQFGNETAVEYRDGTYEIERRIREGDELWRGDPTMELRVVVPVDPRVPPLAEPFQVWGIDAHGTPYLVLSAARCDHDILRRLTEGDWQRGKDAQMRLIVAEAARRAAVEQRERDEIGDMADRLGWAIRRDLHGTRRTFGQVGRGKGD